MSKILDLIGSNPIFFWAFFASYWALSEDIDYKSSILSALSFWSFSFYYNLSFLLFLGYSGIYLYVVGNPHILTSNVLYFTGALGYAKVGVYFDETLGVEMLLELYCLEEEQSVPPWTKAWKFGYSREADITALADWNSCT